MTTSTSPRTIAHQRLAPSALFLLVIGNLVLAAVALVWLWIPDSHTWQLLLSGLLALALLAGFLLCNATVLRRLRTAQPSLPLWAGALVLGGWLVLAALLFHALGLAIPNIEMRAGYWNSQLSHSLRPLLPYARLVDLQKLVIGAAQWGLLPALLCPFAMETTVLGLHGTTFRRALRVWTAGVHWAIALLICILALWLVPQLTAWRPAHTVAGETLSAVLRLGGAALLLLLAVLTLLLTDAELLDRSTLREAPLPPLE